MICDQCETVAHCLKNGCVPKQPALKPLTDEQIDAEFEAFASKFDHESNEWLDMGVDEYFRAGFRAAAPAQPTTEKSSAVQPAAQPVGTYGEIHESMQALLRTGLQRDQQIYMAMKDKPLYTTPPAAQPAPVQQETLDDHAEKEDVESLKRQLSLQTSMCIAYKKENEQLLAANKDCINHFDALKADYDALRAQQEPVALKPCWYESKEKTMCRKCGQIHAEAIPTVAQQEPVSFLDWYDNAHWGNEDFKAGCWRAGDAALEQRTWVHATTWRGLTDEEILQTLDLVAYDTQAFDFAYRIEAKLKEKNSD